jgi:hypothetical protein
MDHSITAAALPARAMRNSTGNALRGIRDFEAVDALARRYGLNLLEDFAMPADNRLLSWQKSGSQAI